MLRRNGISEHKQSGFATGLALMDVVAGLLCSSVGLCVPEPLAQLRARTNFCSGEGQPPEAREGAAGETGFLQSPR